MNKYFCIFCILLFISKTENVFSNNLIYDVNNIEIESKSNNILANKKLIDSVFKKAFITFVDKALLQKDAKSLYSTETSIVKDLVLTYQIIQNEQKNETENLIIFNVKFDPKKINDFLAQRGISYADISNISLTLLPILIKDKEILLYKENYFYKNWVKLTDAAITADDKLISYNLSLENIEDLEYINSIKKNIELIDVQKLNSFYEDTNYVLLIVYSTDDKFKAFIKTSIKKKKIDRNIDLNFYPANEKKSYEKAILTLKKEINQIWKEQNLIDVNTPSFLDFFLDMKKIDDYLKLKSILDTIDVVEKYSVLEMTNEYFKVRLKYRGKIHKIKEKLSEKKVNITIVDNVWKLKIK